MRCHEEGIHAVVVQVQLARLGVGVAFAFQRFVPQRVEQNAVVVRDELLRETDERVDGRFWFRLENGTCVEAENPQVNLDGAENLANYIINLNGGDLAVTDTYISNEEILIHSNAINSNICNRIPDVPEEVSFIMIT